MKDRCTKRRKEASGETRKRMIADGQRVRPGRKGRHKTNCLHCSECNSEACSQEENSKCKLTARREREWEAEKEKVASNGDREEKEKGTMS